MRVTRRPAWPVVFLLGAGASLGSGLEPLQRLNAEIGQWRRIRKPQGGPELAALQRGYEQVTASWIKRWPHEELAWRERLRALSAGGDTAQALDALAGAERTVETRASLRFPVHTRFLMTKVAARHKVRLENVPEWLDMAQIRALEALPAGNHPLQTALRKEGLSAARWRSAQIRAEIAYRAGASAELSETLASLTAESAMPTPDPADRIAIAEQARRRMTVYHWRARLARLRGEASQARKHYRRALQARPIQPFADEALEHQALLAEAAEMGIEVEPGTPIPPAASSGPHWLATAQPMEGFVSDERPAVAAVWTAEGGEPIERAVERLRRQHEVRILTFPNAHVEWIRRFNPLYAAPQLWVIDRTGVIRLVGRLQPGGDGWEDAVTGAALRLPSP